MPDSQSSNDPMRRLALSLFLALLLSTPLAAVDGVIEINQAKALAGGVTPGDTPGFPVIIDQPGSYRLTGDLTVDEVELDAINVRAENVTLDLNGFSILGPLSCTYSESTLNCTPEASGNSNGDGIKVQQGNLAVINGTIRGMGRMGIVNFANNPRPFPVRVENVRLLENGMSGIDLNVTAEVSIHNCIAARNGLWGFAVGDNSRVTSSIAVQNGDRGMLANGENVLISESIFDRNVNNGIWFPGGKSGTLLDNRFTNNGMFGIGGSGDLAYAQNVFSGNGSGTVTGTAIEVGINVCNGSTTCP